MKATCIFPSCTRESYSHGLCDGHYRVARGLVKSGKATWEKLEQAGKSTPVKGKASKARDWFLDQTPAKAK